MHVRRTRRLVAALTVLLVAGAATACRGGGDDGPGTDSAHLTVTVTDWSGWSPDADPKPTERSVTAEPGTTVEVDILGGTLELEVTSIDADEIEVTTDTMMSPVEGEGMNLNDPVTEFTLPRGGEVEFGTPTMDAGTRVHLAEE